MVWKKPQANLYIVHTRYDHRKTKKTPLICKFHLTSKCGVNHTLDFLQYKLFHPHFPRREKEQKCIVFFRKLFLRYANDLNLATEMLKQTYADFLSDVGPLYAISINDYFYIFISRKFNIKRFSVAIWIEYLFLKKTRFVSILIKSFTSKQHKMYKYKSLCIRILLC